MVPDGLTIYAIGDVHGRADLLDALHRQIAADADGRSGRKLIIYLGDYIDRGEHVKETVDLAIAGPGLGFLSRWLKGNHEASMLDFLDNPASGKAWLEFGGRSTLRSYGVAPPASATDPLALLRASDRLLARLPLSHLEFFERLESAASYGDYFFAHAGVRPGLPFDRQIDDDLLWIRDPFLASRLDHGRVVVHGHSVAQHPTVRRNRICVDTGAYRSGRLTCLVLCGVERSFLST